MHFSFEKLLGKNQSFVFMLVSLEYLEMKEALSNGGNSTGVVSPDGRTVTRVHNVTELTKSNSCKQHFAWYLFDCSANVLKVKVLM